MKRPTFHPFSDPRASAIHWVYDRHSSSDASLESELFGHEKGSFTGADRLKIGIFELAKGGVVFLDEIHHLGPDAQKKLLRVIDQKKVRRLGGNVEIPVNFRLISAGKPELKQMALNKGFLADLYFRIKGAELELPSLRERSEDIELLAYHFKAKYEHEKNRKVEFLQSTLEALKQYSWPGNVRELGSLNLRRPQKVF